MFGPLLSWFLYTFRTEGSITAEVLAYQLLVVVVALIGGIWPALFAAVLSGLTLDFLFVEPQFTVTIADPLHAIALALYVIIAILVSVVVDQAARRTRAAQRAVAESELLATVAGSVLRGESAVPALVSRTREAFGMTGVRLLAADGSVLATDGEPVPDDRVIVLPVGVRGGPPWHTRAPRRRARRIRAAPPRCDRRTAGRRTRALRADRDGTRGRRPRRDRPGAHRPPVGGSHDLRRPLAAAVAAVGGLRTAGANLSPDDRDELLATADESLATLSSLVTDLLDVSRVQAGVLAVSLAPVEASAVILAALDELDLGPDDVELALDPELPALLADPVLIQRVLVNVLANAVRHSPPGARVRVATSRLSGTAEIRVVDHGPGIAADRHDDIFAPFQRLGDTDNSTGLGLGLALSRGFTEGMGGALTPEDTPGGGLTMVIALPVAEASVPPATAPERAAR